MFKWKLHTPEGVQDILPEECIVKREVENKIMSIFQSYGYYEIQSPTFEFYDVFAGKSGLIEQETMFKFFDHQGRILVLRPDITTPIARITATELNTSTLPLRLCYTGNAFRYAEPYQGGKLREFTQSGVELIGINTPEADAEVIVLTIHALLAAGLKDFQIDIGQVEFFKGLMEQIALEDEKIEKLRMAIDRKDTPAIEELLKETDIDPQLKEVIISLPSLFGDIKVIENVEKVSINKRTAEALKNLREIYNILLDYGVEKYIAIDLGMVQSINYYTGLIFKGFTQGLGFPICSGGRYDSLIAEFGKNLPAIGVAIGINRVISALDKKNVEFKTWNVDTLISYDSSGRKQAFQIADALRCQGLIVEMNVKGNDTDELIDYAKAKNIGGIINILDEENIQLHNLETDEKVNTTISKLLNSEGE